MQLFKLAQSSIEQAIDKTQMNIALFYIDERWSNHNRQPILSKDLDAIQILKDYMASGSFARGQTSINADASMVYIGNINDTVQNILQYTHLFSSFPPEYNNDSAFFDRMQYYLPGWEMPKMRSELLTSHYGLISDCLGELCKEMRKYDFSHLFDTYFTLNRACNTRDEIGIRETFSGLCKLLYSDGNISKAEAEALLQCAIEGRRWVKEQLRIMAAAEFADSVLGYRDVETGVSYEVCVPEM